MIPTYLPTCWVYHRKNISGKGGDRLCHFLKIVESATPDPNVMKWPRPCPLCESGEVEVTCLS